MINIFRYFTRFFALSQMFHLCLLNFKSNKTKVLGAVLEEAGRFMGRPVGSRDASECCLFTLLLTQIKRESLSEKDGLF